MEIKDKKGSENVVVDHLSHLESNNGIEDPTEIEEFFPNELWKHTFHGMQILLTTLLVSIATQV